MRFEMRYACFSSLRQGSSRQAPLISGMTSWDDVFLFAIRLTLYLPYSRVYVSLSDSFPAGLRFLDHRSSRCIGLDGLLASSTSLQEPCVRFLRSESSFVAALGLHSTPGYFSCEN